MTAVFGTPVAAVLLAVELLLFEWKPRSVIPVITACALAAALRPLVIGSGPLFSLTASLDLSWSRLAASIGVGIVAGLQSGLLTGVLYKTEDFFNALPIHWMWWPALGGIVVGLGGLIEPRALGVGYDIIGDLLSSHMTVAGAWAIIAMGAMMGGTMRSPLTGILFALELTGDMGLLGPLLAATGAAYAVTVLLLKRSILTEKIARRGQHVVHEYSVDPFELLRVADVMVREVDTLPADMTVDQAISFFSTDEPRHKSYPIKGRDGRVIGMVASTRNHHWEQRVMMLTDSRHSAFRIGSVSPVDESGY